MTAADVLTAAAAGQPLRAAFMALMGNKVPYAADDAPVPAVSSSASSAAQAAPMAELLESDVQQPGQGSGAKRQKEAPSSQQQRDADEDEQDPHAGRSHRRSRERSRSNDRRPSSKDVPGTEKAAGEGQRPNGTRSARHVYRSFCPLPVKLLPGVRREAELNRPWLSVAKSMLADAGLGVFALRAFPTGAVLCRFEGSLLAGVKPLANKVTKGGPANGAPMANGGANGRPTRDTRSYILSLHSSGGWVLDGGPVAKAIRRGAEEVEITVLTPGGDHTKVIRKLDEVGVGCMVNHGSAKSANAKFILMKSDRSGFLPCEAYLQAMRDIAEGEELLARYGNAESTAWG